MPFEVSQERQVTTFFDDTLVVLVVMGDTIDPQSLQQCVFEKRTKGSMKENNKKRNQQTWRNKEKKMKRKRRGFT